jgi:hypothetical protein
MFEANYDKILEVCDELTDYDGVLPLLIRAVVMKKYSRKLKKKGLYHNVIRECIRTKPHTYEEAVKELQDWVKVNNDYEDLIKK